MHNYVLLQITHGQYSPLPLRNPVKDPYVAQYYKRTHLLLIDKSNLALALNCKLGLAMRIQSLVIFFLAIGDAYIYCQQLRYALLTAGPLTGGFDSSGAVPAIELAEEIINADRSILPGYNLTHTPVLDTLVSLRYI